MRDKTIYYSNYSEDFIHSKNQDYKLPRGYVWIHNNIFYRIFSHIIFRLFGLIGRLYCYLFFRIQVINRELLDDVDGGFFLYGNHTQPIVDVFSPSIAYRHRRFFTVVSASNLGIPILGRLLPIVGALPIPHLLHNFRGFLDAITTRITEGSCVVIYPEAHVWPYCTFIREFSETSFRYPVELRVPSYTMTTTYHKNRGRRRPRIIIYIDGPFYPDTSLPQHESRRQLRDKIYNTMNNRSKNNNCEYIHYIYTKRGE